MEEGDGGIFQLVSCLQSYTKEYGKQVEGSVNIQSLTGAPYTVINKVSVEWVRGERGEGYNLRKDL